MPAGKLCETAGAASQTQLYTTRCVKLPVCG